MQCVFVGIFVADMYHQTEEWVVQGAVYRSRVVGGTILTPTQCEDLQHINLNPQLAKHLHKSRQNL